MSGVFRNIDPPTPHRPASVYTPTFGAGRGHTRWVERGWGVNTVVQKTPYTALYSIYVSTFWGMQSRKKITCYSVSAVAGTAVYADLYHRMLAAETLAAILDLTSSTQLCTIWS